MQTLRAWQMGTTRVAGCRRFDEEAWEQCYDVATVARWSPVNRARVGDECTVKRNERNLRPHRQVEPSASRGMGPTKCSWVVFHTIKADEALCSAS